MKWGIAEAKQRFAEVVRKAAEEPQLIFNRDRLVAALVDAADFEAFRAWRETSRKRTVADAFAEFRELAAQEDFSLEIPERSDRQNPFAESA